MNARLFLLLLTVLTTGCEKISPFISDVLWKKRIDMDGDKIPRPDDCDDRDPNPKGSIRIWYRDLDKDGLGAGEKIIACVMPAQTTITNSDCDDTRATIYPNAIEQCDALDNDCDGETDETFTNLGTSCGTGVCAGGKLLCAVDHLNTICSTDGSKSTEICDALDNDCDGETDESTAMDAKILFADVDQDGHGNLLVTKKTCETESGWSQTSDDCNDLNKSIHPNAKEICNLIDDNCNKQIDEGASLTFFPDTDKDGYGALAGEVTGCAASDGYVSNNADCNDQKKDVHPKAIESCDNKVDDDCDGMTDNAKEAILWYLDADKDGYGTKTVSLYACATPINHVANKTDCDDANPNSYPNAIEICKDGIDNDCNGITDTDTKNVTWYLDADKDGFGTITQSKEDCVKPTSYVENSLDCSDTNASIHPGVVEVCNNGTDDNCDGSVNQCILTGVMKIANTNTIQITGPEAHGFATAVTTCDVDGDGILDLLVGVPGWNANQGKVSVYLSPLKSGMIPSHEIVGPTNGLFGTSLACTSSKTEVMLAVGSPGDQTGGGSAGALYLFKGLLLKKTSAKDANVAWIGSKQNMEVGISCQFLPDQDGDQLSDLFVGADGYNEGVGSFAGAGFLVSSGNIGTNQIQNTLAILANSTKDELAGSALTVGFLNPDEKPDFILGAFSSDTAATDAGAVYIELGPLSGSKNTSGSKPLYGTSSFDNLGQSICSGFDLTGDALEDVLIGAPGNGNSQNTGFVQIARWNTESANPPFLVTTLESMFGGDRLGYSVSSGNINTDLLGDILVGAPGADDAGSNFGSVFLQYGPILKNGNIRLTANARIDGESTNGQLGWLAKITPDLTGDKISDLVIVAKSTKPLRKLYVLPGLGL